MPLHHTWLRHVYLNWYFVLIHFQAALFAYWLCRDLERSLGRPCWATAFGLGPFLGSAEWPAALNAAVWAPLQLMYFFRAARDQRPMASALACGAALGASWLSGADQIPLLLTLALAALWIWHAARVRQWKFLLAASASTLGVSAFQALPALQYLARHPLSGRDIPATVWTKSAVAHLLFGNRDAGIRGPRGLRRLDYPDAGGQSGCGAEHRNTAARVSGYLAGAGLLLSFGHYVMFGGILRGFGILDKDPRDALVFFGIGLAVLSAAGLDGLLSMPMPRASRVLAAIGAFCLALMFRWSSRRETT